jgi:YgiT-type zinc finger domain-containing protein
MAEKVCNFCGSSDYIQKRVEYVYRHQGRYMVFRDVPAEVCRRCGMRYFSAQVLLTIERRFFEIHDLHRQPAHTVVVPIETFA